MKTQQTSIKQSTVYCYLLFMKIIVEVDRNKNA